MVVLSLSWARVRWKSDRASWNLWAAGEPGVRAPGGPRARAPPWPRPAPRPSPSCSAGAAVVGRPQLTGATQTGYAAHGLLRLHPRPSPEPQGTECRGRVLPASGASIPQASPPRAWLEAPGPTRILIAPGEASGLMRRRSPESPPALCKAVCGRRACPAALIPSLGRACCREPGRQRTPAPAESWDAPFLQPCPGFPEGRMGRITPSRSPRCRNGGGEPAEALCDPLPHRAQGDCAARHGDRETRPHVTRSCPWAPRSRGRTWPEEVTVGRQEHRKDSVETKGRQRRKRACPCSPLQLEVGHSALEEADSQAGVLGHCLVKCLRTEMSVGCSGL